MITDQKRADSCEPSYFNFLMTSRRSRRATVRFIQTGIPRDWVRNGGVTSAGMQTVPSKAVHITRGI